MAIHRLAIAFLLLAALAVGGCGGTAPVDTGDVTTPPTTPTEPVAGPTGPIDYDGVGPARQGMTSDEVIELFGEPASQDTVPGCPLDPEAQKQLVLKYDLPSGELSIAFNTDPDELRSTFTDSPDLETADAISVGDSYQDLSSATGNDLQPLTLGVEATPEEGFWFTEQDPTQRITYDIEKGKVARILSGDTPACE